MIGKLTRKQCRDGFPAHYARRLISAPHHRLQLNLILGPIEDQGQFILGEDVRQTSVCREFEANDKLKFVEHAGA